MTRRLYNFSAGPATLPPAVLEASARALVDYHGVGAGIAELWQKVLDHRTAMNAAGEFAARRRQQQVKWMWSMLEQRLMSRLRADPSIRAKVKKTEVEVAEGRIAPAVAAEQIAGMLR